jgi:uncharacterized membrane protein YedE/YeeE
MTTYWAPLIGGMIIGLSAVILLIVNGRIAGISGIAGRMLGGNHPASNAAFLVGLLLGPLVYAAAYGRFPEITIAATWPVIVVAGLFVGIGTRMGSGCTSGHGILGLARFSKRSVVATATFLATGIALATLSGVVR